MLKLPYFLMLASVACATYACPVVLLEEFEDPLDAWESRWLGLNSDLGNYYGVSAGRGNNPDGLWAVGSGGPNSSGPIVVTFAPGFDTQITSLSLDVAGYTPTDLEIIDGLGNTIFLQSIVLTSGAYTDPGTYAHYDIASANGIRSFSFTSGNSAGNTSIDNVQVTIDGTPRVPEAASTLTLLALASLGLGLMRQKQS